jgi:hypothetical protein
MAVPAAIDCGLMTPMDAIDLFRRRILERRLPRDPSPQDVADCYLNLKALAVTLAVTTDILRWRVPDASDPGPCHTMALSGL